MKKLGGVALISALVVAGCGGGSTTTVIKESAPTTVEKTTTVTAKPKPAPAPEPEPEVSAQPPNVVGLPLPAAEEALEEAGFKAAPRNTDTTFGIVVPSHYTICKEGTPRGKQVPVLAQKYGC
jgi:hypothetical protein